MIDTRPFWGINYYQLRQTDYDGSHSYSKTIAVRFSNKESDQLISTLYPNPAKDILNITVTETVSLQLLDPEGREILAQAVVHPNTKHNLSTQALQNGIYVLRVCNDRFTSMRKVLINR